MLRCLEKCFKFVSAAEVAGIANDELILKMPFLSQRIAASIDRHDCLVVAPIGDHRDLLRANAQM